MDGLTAARELSRLFPDLPLLMHTLHWSQQVEVEAQKAGVRKVVPKADSRGLVAAIHLALSAEPPFAVAALTESIPAILPPPGVTALPPIDSQNAAPADPPDPPAPPVPDEEVSRSRPPT
jgi:DNA-binding NarL/FixJ family response regulator